MEEIKNLLKIRLFLGIVIIAVTMFMVMPINVFATTDQCSKSSTAKQYETPEEAQQIIDQIKESNIDPDELLSFIDGYDEEPIFTKDMLI